MKRVRLSKFIKIGQIVRYLFDARVGWAVHGSGNILTNIGALLQNFDDLNLKVSSQAALGLIGLQEELSRRPPEATISQSDRTRLHKAMELLRHTLTAEATTLDAYVLREKRFDVKRLVRGPDFFFAPETFNKLPPIAQFDVREAGKCIAFELPTAGAFHLLRATEDALRSFYRTFIKRGEIEKSTWGQLVQKLKDKKKKPKPDETLLNHLDHIRKNFRNPTDHPQKTYDIDGVQDLFSLVVDVLNRMATALPEPGDDDVATMYGLGNVDDLLLSIDEPADGPAAEIPEIGEPTVESPPE